MVYEKLKDAIAAISTPLGSGGISVIRISGSDAFIAADRFFKCKNGKKPSEMKGYTCAYGDVFDSSEKKIDSCILTVFKAPHSYTGENVVEVSCHGGMFVTREVLRAAFDSGCKPAAAGEFTKRAFFNGKLSLNQAESVMEIISAGNQAELDAAHMMESGRNNAAVFKIKNSLVEILGKLSVWVDYPDDEVPEITHDSLHEMLDEVNYDIENLLRTYDYGVRLKKGITTAIIGEPNVGKSTLFNLLVGHDRSIVTDIEGTTRDVVEETVQLGKITLRLWDTAGIRETSDKIENIGIGFTFDKIKQAQLILMLLDATSPLFDEYKSLEEELKGKSVIAVVNKTDLLDDSKVKFDIEALKKITDNIVFVSAKEKIGFSDLEKEITKMFFNDNINAEVGYAANDRQLDCLKSAEVAIKKAIEFCECNEFLDIITEVIDEALDSILKLTGEKITDTVVNEVFSKFCVGK